MHQLNQLEEIYLLYDANGVGHINVYQGMLLFFALIQCGLYEVPANQMQFALVF